MYYRSPESHRTPSPLPLHYGGNAFRPDGTPVEVPVRRESDIPLRERTRESDNESNAPQADRAEASFEEVSAEKSVNRQADFLDEEKDTRAPSFLSRLLQGILPNVKEDDLLLLLLMLLLSREEGNEEILLLLTVLLFGS